MFTYQITKENLWNEEVGNYIGFGVSVYDKEQDKITVSISDVFTNQRLAEDFIEKCNRLELSPMHLLDVIEDIL